MPSQTDSAATQYGEIFSIIDDVGSASSGNLPLGAEARFWRAVDQLRDRGEGCSSMSALERLGQMLFRLRVTLYDRHAEGEIAHLRQSIGSLGRHWLADLPMAYFAQPALTRH